MHTNIFFIVAAIAATTAGAQNILPNGSFEDGLTGWSSTGIVSVVDAEVSRDFIDPVAPDWLPTHGNLFASLWSTDSAGVGASSLDTTFEVGAGFELSFWYFFDFGDFTDSPDTVTISVIGAGGETVLAEHNTPAGGFLADNENIEWTHIEHVFTDPGEHTLRFNVTDANGVFESILGIDDVQVVPAPGVIALVGFGFAGSFRCRRA